MAVRFARVAGCVAVRLGPELSTWLPQNAAQYRRLWHMTAWVGRPVLLHFAKRHRFVTPRAGVHRVARRITPYLLEHAKGVYDDALDAPANCGRPTVLLQSRGVS